MKFLEHIAQWIQGQDFAIPGEVLVVLDGENFERRLAVGLDLLRRRYGQSLLISLGESHHLRLVMAGKAAAEQPSRVRLIRHQAPTIWHEAAEIRASLRESLCARVVIVAPWYRTRRVRLVFTRTLKSDGIMVSVCPVHARPEEWKSGDARAAILQEPARLLAAWLHRRLPPQAERREAPIDKRKAA